MDHTFASIERLKERILREFPAIDSRKLDGYLYVDGLHDLIDGRFIRWIDVSNPTKLFNGGFIARVDIEPDRIRVTCINHYKRLFQFFFDESIVFRKLSLQEKIIFQANGF